MLAIEKLNGAVLRLGDQSLREPEAYKLKMITMKYHDYHDTDYHEMMESGDSYLVSDLSAKAIKSIWLVGFPFLGQGFFFRPISTMISLHGFVVLASEAQLINDAVILG